MRRLFFLLLAFATAISAPAAWRSSETSPRLYQASLAGWTLTVDASRARLSSLVPPGGSPEDNVLLGGGHRVWLGPQTEWPVFWPPPRDWEESAAASVSLSDDAATLTLVLPRTDKRFPALTRHYVLQPDALLLVAEWSIDSATTPEDFPSHQAVHILQTRPDTLAILTPRPGPEAPLGHGLLALAVRPGTILDQPIPPAFVADRAKPASDSPGPLTLAFTGEEEKIGVPPQPLLGRFPSGHQLRLLPTLHDGVVDARHPAPEAGLFTQAYFGGAGWAMVELEQLSPRLLPSPDSRTVSVTVRLEFLPPP